MLTLPVYAKKKGYRYESVKEIIKFLEIEPDAEIQQFRAYEESRLDTLFEALKTMKNYNLKKEDYPSPDKTKSSAGTNNTTTSFRK